MHFLLCVPKHKKALWAVCEGQLRIRAASAPGCDPGHIHRVCLWPLPWPYPVKGPITHTTSLEREGEENEERILPGKSPLLKGRRMKKGNGNNGAGQEPQDDKAPCGCWRGLSQLKSRGTERNA